MSNWHCHDEYIRASKQQTQGTYDDYCSLIFRDTPFWEPRGRCPFPDDFEDLVIESNQELFMCMSSYAYSERMILFEGFVPHANVQSERKGGNNSHPTLSIDFRGLDFSRWLQMDDLLSLKGEKAAKSWTSLDIHGLDLDVTLIALPKSKRITAIKTLKAGLVCSYFYFKNWPELNYGHYEVCSEGRVASSPHELVRAASSDACRYIRLVKENSGGDFLGWKIEDGASPLLI